MQLVVVREERAADLALGLSGELDLASAAVLRHEVAQALARTPKTLYLDLTATTFLDSTGCRELIATVRSGSAAGSAVELVVPPENRKIRRVLDLMQFGELLPVRDALPAS